MKKIFRMLPIVAKAEWPTFLAVVFGTCVYSAGVMAFTVPFRFPDSGVVGVSVLLNYSLGISIPLVVAAANVALLLWAWRELSLRVVVWTVISVGLNTVLMKLLEGMPYPQTDQVLLVALIGGAVKGYGGGIVLRNGVSLGGLDIVMLYLQKKYGIEIGKYNFYINMCIVGAGTFIVGVENAMLGLAGIYASSVMIDSTISAFDKRRQVFVVTKDPCPIVEFVSAHLGRGSTVLDAHGGYSGEGSKLLICLLTRRQAVELKRFIAENHPKTFMVVSDASEVLGLGFKPWK